MAVEMAQQTTILLPRRLARSATSLALLLRTSNQQHHSC
jgi:hypothetical protein